MKNIKRLCMSALIVCLITSAAFAAPQKVNFQGKLTDADGNPISVSVSMTFTIWDALTDGNALWTETQTVTVTNGIYNVLLGANNAIDTELTETKTLWLGVKVGADAEMSPRVELTPGMYDLIMLNTITVKDGNVGIGLQRDSKFSVKSEVVNKWAGIFFSPNDVARTFLGIEDRLGDPTGDWAIWTEGKVNISGTLYVSGQDIAEPFDMTDIASLELGDVVVMDPANPKHLTKSLTAYDHKVAGIVSSSEQAGYVAGSRSDGSSDKPVALTGRVLCKVSAENGAIEVGDLLTTSNTPGYAMKATDRDKAFGAVLGKALEAFDGDKGQILVLVALQ